MVVICLLTPNTRVQLLARLEYELLQCQYLVTLDVLCVFRRLLGNWTDPHVLSKFNRSSQHLWGRVL